MNELIELVVIGIAAVVMAGGCYLVATRIFDAGGIRALLVSGVRGLGLERRRSPGSGVLLRRSVKACLHEAWVVRRGLTVLAAEWRVLLNPADYERVAPIKKWAEREVARGLQDAARERELRVAGPVSVHLVSDSGPLVGHPKGVPYGGAEAMGRHLELDVLGHTTTMKLPEGEAPTVRFPPEDVPTARLVMVGISTVEGAGMVRLDPGGSPIRLGRSSKADVQVKDPTVSSRHALLRLKDGRLEVADRGSTNGTRVRADGQDRKLKAKVWTTIPDTTVLVLGPTAEVQVRILSTGGRDDVTLQQTTP